MFSLLSCVETFKEIEIFVEQYCINWKGIEKKIFWQILMGFRIFRILNLVYLWGGPLLFWKLGDKNFSKTNIFFSGAIFQQTIFFMPAKKFSWAFFALANIFFRDQTYII